MADKTRIEWADTTWNPCTGCTPVSEACEHCYAERMARRFTGHFAPTFHPSRLDKPLHWRKPRRIFVCSMSDLFHETFTDEQRDAVLDVVYRCPQHTFLILTKRPTAMQCYLAGASPITGRTRTDDLFNLDRPLPNLYLGVTAETQQRADERIPILLDTPAAVRFVSLEPLLEPVTLRWLPVFRDNPHGRAINPDDVATDHLDGARRLDWVILGGETGPGARPMQPKWALDVYRQCREAEVPFFFKKWGSAFPGFPEGQSLGNLEQTREFPGVA